MMEQRRPVLRRKRVKFNRTGCRGPFRVYAFLRYWGNGVDVIDDKHTPHFFTILEFNRLMTKGRIYEG